MLGVTPSRDAVMAIIASPNSLLREVRLSGRNAGQLYFVSTFGSAAGTISTAFYLVLYLEINQIIWTLAVISAILAAIGIGWKPRNAF